MCILTQYPKYNKNQGKSNIWDTKVHVIAPDSAFSETHLWKLNRSITGVFKHTCVFPVL